ncbi:hypothetical protein ACWDRR_43535 [Kitasatospora sp. NPDC003701]
MSDETLMEQLQREAIEKAKAEQAKKKAEGVEEKGYDKATGGSGQESHPSQ